MVIDPKEQYLAEMHGMQTGVAMDIELMGLADAGASPKHLRVGINGALADQASLVRLLISKGYFTEKEYIKQLAIGAKLGREAFERRISKRLGKTVKLR